MNDKFYSMVLKYLVKILLTIIYPFWYFFAKTWFGGVMFMCLVPMSPVCIMAALFPNMFKGVNNDDSKSLLVVIGILIMLLSPFVFCRLMSISDYIVEKYKSYGYKITSYFSDGV